MPNANTDTQHLNDDQLSRLAACRAAADILRRRTGALGAATGEVDRAEVQELADYILTGTTLLPLWESTVMADGSGHVVTEAVDFDTDTTDAAVWARQFVARFYVQRQTGGDPMVEEVDDPTGLMIGWFANAIEAGRRAVESHARLPEVFGDAPTPPGEPLDPSVLDPAEPKL